MSSRFTSEQLASIRRGGQRSIESAGEQADHARALLAVGDVLAACRSSARLLITASTQQSVETLARRIHGNGPRAQSPFVVTSARELAVGAQALKEDCARFLDAAAGGSVLVSAVEEMPAAVQEVLIDLLAGLESARRPSAAVRLISGTTVSLLDRVAAGTFSSRLFYRLNIIHLIVGNGSPAAALS
jgi:two-component system, NtrC family, C4-dicarboxylate transport response regulator DctD